MEPSGRKETSNSRGGHGRHRKHSKRRSKSKDTEKKTPNNISAAIREEDPPSAFDPTMMCEGSLFNDALCASQTVASINESQLEEGLRQSWRAATPPLNPDFIEEARISTDLVEQARISVSSSDDTSNDKLPDKSNTNHCSIPVRPPVPVPIPIQHCIPNNSLQRPAMQFSNKAEDLEEMSIREIIATVRKGQSSGSDNGTDKERRLKDFERARSMRRKHYEPVTPRGIFGLFEYLSGIRTDLQWAEYVAYQRSHTKSYVTWGDYMKQHEERYQRRPYMIYLITFISTVMMFYTMYLGDWKFAPLNVSCG